MMICCTFFADARTFAVEPIELLDERTETNIKDDRRTQLAVLHAVQTVGEAAYKTTDDQKLRLPQLP